MADSLSDLGKFDFNDNLNGEQIKKNLSRNGNSSSGIINLNGNKSLFQRNATIDYARYVRNEPWEDFKRDAGGKFIPNKLTKLNEPVEGDKEIDDIDGLSIQHLIKWSEKYPSLQLRYQDFVYCRNIGYFPNNRLIVLRRFKNGVPDNLFDFQVKNSNTNSNAYLYTQPLATMITWLKPDETPLSLTFNEGWEDGGPISDAFSQLEKDVKGGESIKTGSNNFDSSILGALLDTLGGDFVRVDGVEFLGRSIEGNPNLVAGSKKRTTGPGKANIVSSISFPNLSFEYEMRYINNVDPGIAIIDLISNCLRMGTSVSEFKYPIKFLTNNELITNLINGEFEINFENFEKAMKEFFGKVKDTYTKTANEIIANASNIAKNPSGTLSKVTDKAIKQFISTYRESLKASLAYDTGMPSGVWHITIGNPKNPIVSCGDLIVETSKLELGKELGYNDFPNTFTVTYTLKSARHRGRNELERIFNAGRGRVYVYEDWRMNPDYDQYISDANSPTSPTPLKPKN